MATLAHIRRESLLGGKYAAVALTGFAVDADVKQDVGSGRLILRLSGRRMRDPLIRQRLGREAPRLSDVSILWDEDAAQMIRLYDVGRPDDEVEWDFDPDGELDTFELTDAALSSIAHHGGEP